MANIKPYTDAIANAVYGEEVRSSIINALTLVNEDNESYAQIKQDILDAKDHVDTQVEAFDGKVSDAQTTITNLENATTAGNTAKGNLESATTTANTAKTNLETATSNANTAITNAGNAKTALDGSITNAGTAKTNLDGSISTATSKKTALDGSISDAGTAKTALDGSISTSATSKTNLDGSITNAGTAKTQLESVITSAGTIKGELSGVVTDAGTAKTALDTSVTTANSVLQSLTNENTSAVSNLAELRSENFNSQEILAGVANIEAYLGITTDVAGLSVDYKNKTFTRLAGAFGKTAGSDFDHWKCYGDRKRCNVTDGGVITAYYGDTGYTETGALEQAITVDGVTYPIGTAVQVMVYQPKFYYLVAPVDYDVQATGVGYHLRKANYYVSDKPRTGFRLHPAFYDKNGNEIEYILMGAYESCLYDDSASAYITDDSQVMDTSVDKLSSIANVKPASGETQQFTRPNVEALAQNRGLNWHGSTVKIASMNQLLCMIEMGTMNFQSAIGKGVVDYASGTGNEASNTGATSSLGNGTGQATETTHVSSGGTTTTDTVAGKLSVSYRGLENPWGNIWEFEYGVNIWGNGSMAGGQPYYATDFEFAESKNSGNYENAGFTVAPSAGYISAMGYSTKCDWLFMASETLGNDSLPVGDYTYVTENLNGYRIAQLGGTWTTGARAGGFYWHLYISVGNRTRNVGGRLVYVPVAQVA